MFLGSTQPTPPTQQMPTWHPDMATLPRIIAPPAHLEMLERLDWSSTHNTLGTLLLHAELGGGFRVELRPLVLAGSGERAAAGALDVTVPPAVDDDRL